MSEGEICQNCGENIDGKIYSCEECGNEICDMCSIICKKCGESFCDSCFHDHKKNCK